MNSSLSKRGWLLSLVALAGLIAAMSVGTTLRAQSRSKLRVVSSTVSPADGSPAEKRRGSSLRGEPNKKSSLRLREGTNIADELGYFKQNGDGATFVSKENHKFGGLPNLNLERILRMLKGTEEPEEVKWSVSGTVTEFDGKNYLLITRAVYKSNSLPPAPERVSE